MEIKIQYFLFGAIFGALFVSILSLIFTKAIMRKYLKTVGTLRIDHSDPDGMYMFLEIDHGKFETIANSNYIKLRVNTKSYISRD